jgi:catechol 2,3-dioxygenase-like lactoylglutathione lyase family enzyme
MATAHRVAPIFSVRDLDAAMDFYRRLGFSVRAYRPGVGYGFASRDGVEIHLGVPGREHHPGSAYLFVDDADQLAAAWQAAGIEVFTPQDTEWGRHEGALVDPDGNNIRFGSPMEEAAGGRARADVQPS